MTATELVPAAGELIAFGLVMEEAQRALAATLLRGETRERARELALAERERLFGAREGEGGG